MVDRTRQLLVVLVPLAAAAVAFLAAALTAAPSNYLWFPVPEHQRAAVVEACRQILVARGITWALMSSFVTASLLLAWTGKRTGAVAAGVGALMCLLAWPQLLIYQAPRFLQIFQYQAVAEHWIERPLLQAGSHVAPALVPRLSDPTLRNRRYAILAAGRLRLRSAVPVLAQLLRDRSQETYIRGDAYEALLEVDTSEAKRVLVDFDRSADPQADGDLLEYLGRLHSSQLGGA